jgi:hypothetical protein
LTDEILARMTLGMSSWKRCKSAESTLRIVCAKYVSSVVSLSFPVQREKS